MLAQAKNHRLAPRSPVGADALEGADAVVERVGEERYVGSRLAREDFAEAMRAFAELRGPIDLFFDKVTVNVMDKPDLRLNRLKLLNHIRSTIPSATLTTVNSAISVAAVIIPSV